MNRKDLEALDRLTLAEWMREEAANDNDEHDDGPDPYDCDSIRSYYRSGCDWKEVA
jgi:hypothetical protein